LSVAKRYLLIDLCAEPQFTLPPFDPDDDPDNSKGINSKDCRYYTDEDTVRNEGVLASGQNAQKGGVASRAEMELMGAELT
jgi:hypothetical protein